MKKILLVPGNTDLNRGDQALVWESIRLIEEVYDNPEITLMHGSESELYEQTNALGYPFVTNILRHPVRIFKNYNHVSYTKLHVLLIGLRAILDFFIVSLLLVRCKFINKLGLWMLPQECKKTFSEYEQCDAVYVKGGGFIHSYGAITDPYQIFYLLYPILLGIRFKKDIVILPNSIGPLKNKLARKISLYVLNHCRYISVRESVSEQFLLSQEKLRTKVHKHADLGYFLKSASNYDSKAYLKGQGVDVTKPIVGITLRPYRFPGEDNPKNKYQNYINGFVSLIEYLDSKHYQVVLFSHTLGPGAHENDSLAIDDVSIKLKQLHVPHFCIKDYDLDCRHVMSIYSNFAYLIGTRFHSVIFAQNSSVPTIAIAYGGNKGVGIMGDVGLSDFSIPMNSITGDALITLFERLEIKHEEVREILINRKNELHQDRDKMIGEIREILSI